MVKKHDIKNLIIILLFCLFSFGKTQTVDWLEYSVSKNVVEKKESNAPLKKVYGLEFKDDMSKDIANKLMNYFELLGYKVNMR